MVRLMLVAAPSFVLLGAVGLSGLIGTYMKDVRQLVAQGLGGSGAEEEDKVRGDAGWTWHSSARAHVETRLRGLHTDASRQCCSGPEPRCARCVVFRRVCASQGGRKGGSSKAGKKGSAAAQSTQLDNQRVFAAGLMVVLALGLTSYATHCM